MENSVYLAQLLGPVFAFMGLAFAFRLNDLPGMIKEFGKNKGLIYFSSITMMVAGMAMVLAHNVWEWSWVLIVTILGWSILVKGALYAAVPGAMLKMAAKMAKMKWIFVLAVVMWLGFGLCLTYYGYFA